MDRRDFLKWMGVASGGSLLAGCNLERNSEKLIPYLVPPEDGVIPGDATFVTTSCVECPVNCGVSTRIRDGRPVKLDGIEGHPVNDGALCIRGQSSLNRLYNPERIRQPLVKGETGELVPATWDEAVASVNSGLQQAGEHVYLSGRTSGSLSGLIDEYCTSLNVERLPEYEFIAYAAIRRANQDLFGRGVVPSYHIDRADFVLTLGEDLIATGTNPVRDARALADKTSDDHFHWYHVESGATLTGYSAGHRYSVRPGSEAFLLAFLLQETRNSRVFADRTVDEHVEAVPSVTAADVTRETGLAAPIVSSLRDAFLGAHHPLVVAGGTAVAHERGLETARLAALLQMAAGMIGSTVDFNNGPDYARVGNMNDVRKLVARLEAGKIGVMFVATTDPVGQLPDGGEFAAALARASLVVGIGDVLNETMSRCDVILPLSHALESWGDAEPVAGVVSAIQPAFEPLYDTASAGDALLRIMNATTGANTTYQEYVLARWNRLFGAEAAAELLAQGYIKRSVRNASVALVSNPGYGYTFANKGVADGPCLAIVPSVRWYDGRSAELPLLHEIPDPLTSVSWDNWVSISETDASQMGLKDADVIELSLNGWSTELPVRRQPGLQKNVFQIHKGIADPPVGWQEGSGEVNALLPGVNVRKTSKRMPTTILAGALREHGRGAVPGHHPAHFGHGDEPEGEHKHEDVSFNPEPVYPEYRWAMAVDMDRCSGCSACVAACYIENNVPMVGREEHIKGREMSWLKVETYYDEEGAADHVLSMCQQCDWAPCEAVCPVIATYHNDEGLNAQVYNRCVGTRYCANNCPYKQRRFNWFAWNKRAEPLNLMVNPDVSLRGKGIMEKCSFCVQRIRKARDIAKDENRKILEGDVVPACAQACPGTAIAFGNLLDENSEVAKWANSDRSNKLLEELGTGPAVYYLSNEKGKHHDA